ncbi:hypothetical protein ALC62_13644, partial [Cyphomyrmex costatus]
ISQSSDIERDLIQQANQLSTREEYVAWEQRCDEFIESLEEQRIKRTRLSIGNRQSVIARIARLESLKESVSGRFVYVGAKYGLRWREIETAFESRILTGAVINSNHIEPCRFLEDASEIVLERVQCIMQRYDSIKINTVFNGEFVAGDKRANKSIATRNYEIYRCTDQREWYVSRVVEPILASLEEFQERDSGWALSRILNLTVNVNKLNPLRAGCHIKLPREIMSKRAVINVQSENNACFAWSVVAALHPAESHTSRTSSYPHYSSVLNLTGIEFPMTLNQIKEALNDISINVYAIENEIVPIRLAERKRSKHVNLLYVEDDIGGHFVLIKNLSRLVRSQVTKMEHKKYFCDSSSAKLEVHSEDCGKLNNCGIRLPSEDDKWLEFKNHCRKERVPFVVYADLECALEKMDKDPASSTYTYQHHNVFSIAYYVHCSYNVFHNLSGYDAHFIIKKIATAYEGRVDLLPITKEKYISFTKHVDDTIDDKKNCIQLRFINSYRFLASSLDKLSSFLSKDKLRVLRREFSHLSEENFNLLTRKGVFPYEYIDCSKKLNELRTLAKNDFEKNLYKLMNNAVFGKTMENMHDRVDVKLLTKWEGRYGAEAMIAKLNFHSRSVFLENLVAIELRKLEMKFDKPIYVGMCILDISKMCLYEFHHEYMAPLFHDKCKIIYTDTDSLIYHVECDDVYEIIKRDIDRFDTSDYSVDNPFRIPLANKKVPGLMKDENNGAIMTEFVGLRAKMYALRV